ncbi:hypothetical protein [Duganella sp. BuS-21]|uniref:hypothetical protein n=1 Tax=Duganella sp. BuS-21 TaxID=2943848 RepID=UPI0035A5EA78
MPTTFQLTMHPASEGDALQLAWGQGGQHHHAWIDLGRTRDYKQLRAHLHELGTLALLVFSHIDADHIEGAVALFKDAELPFDAERVWFNARLQHEQAYQRRGGNNVPLSSNQAEKVTAGLLRTGWPLNGAFPSGIVSVESLPSGAAIPIASGLQVRLLSPSDHKLGQLLPEWDDTLKAAKVRTTDPDAVASAIADGRVRLGRLDVQQLATAPFKRDDTKPNGASIAFIAEFEGKRVLLGADAHPDILEESLRTLGASKQSRYHLDCYKVSHHGSKANTSPELLSLIDCTRFAFSTDGSRHQHPDPETIARILTADPYRAKTLYFNSRHYEAQLWNNKPLMDKWNYTCVYPAKGSSGLTIDI